MPVLTRAAALALRDHFDTPSFIQSFDAAMHTGQDVRALDRRVLTILLAHRDQGNRRPPSWLVPARITGKRVSQIRASIKRLSAIGLYPFGGRS